MQEGAGTESERAGDRPGPFKGGNPYHDISPPAAQQRLSSGKGNRRKEPLRMLCLAIAGLFGVAFPSNCFFLPSTTGGSSRKNRSPVPCDTERGLFSFRRLLSLNRYGRGGGATFHPRRRRATARTASHPPALPVFAPHGGQGHHRLPPSARNSTGKRSIRSTECCRISKASAASTTPLLLTSPH